MQEQSSNLHNLLKVIEETGLIFVNFNYRNNENYERHQNGAKNDKNAELYGFNYIAI